MGIVFRQSVKTTIVNFAGAALGALLVLMCTYVLSKPEYGFTKNITLEGALIQFIVLLGTSSLASTFTQRYAANDARKKVLLTICGVVPILATILFTIPYLALRPNIVGLYQPADRAFIDKYYSWVPVMVFFWSLMAFLDQYLISQLKVAASSFMREVLLRLCNLLVIALYYFKLISFAGVVAGTVLIYVAPVVAMLLIAIRTPGFGFSMRWNAFTRAEYREMAHYSWYHLMFGASLNLIGYFDSLMLAPLDKAGMGSLAVYSVAIYAITLIVFPYRAMISATYPVLNKAYIDRDEAKLKDLFHRSGINILIVAIAMFLLIACNLETVVKIFPPGYEAIPELVMILMLGRMIDMSTGLNSELISISKYYRFNFHISLMLVGVAFALNWFLIPRYGFYGAAWSATIALAIFNIAKMIFLRQKMHLLPFTNKSWRVLFAGGISFLAVYFIPHTYQRAGANFFGLFLDAGWRSILLVVIYTSLLIILKPSIDLNEYLKTVRANKRLF